MNPHEESPHDVAEQVDLARAKLLHTVEELDHRRHDASNVHLQLETHARAIAVAGGISAFVMAGLVEFVVHRVATAPARRRRSRWQLLGQLWTDPQRALRAQRQPFFVEALRSVGISLITLAVMVPARLMVAKLVHPAQGAPAIRPAASAP